MDKLNGFANAEIIKKSKRFEEMKKRGFVYTVTGMTMAAMLCLAACGAPENEQTQEAPTQEAAVELAPNVNFVDGEQQPLPNISDDDAQQDAATEDGADAGADDANAQDQTTDAGTENIVSQNGTPVRSIYEKIQNQVELVSPMEPSEEFIFNYYGIDVQSLDEYVFELSETSLSAETIVILRSGDATIRENAASALETIRSDKLMELENYLPDQYDITARAQVKENGDYVYLVISENDATITQMIESSL